MTSESKPAAPFRIARDLMIPVESYPCLPETATLAEAITAICGGRIERRGTLSLPRLVLLTDLEGCLVGLLRRRDIMRGLLPEFLTETASHAEAEFDVEGAMHLDLADLFRDDGQNILERNRDDPASRVMQPVGGAVGADADLMEIIKLMVRNEFHILAVEEDGQVIGVVRTVEVLNQIGKVLRL